MAIYTVDLNRHDEIGNVRVVVKSNRTWECLSFPRSLLSVVRHRDEEVRSGVYVLWGYKDYAGKPCVYVGRSDEVFSRLGTHERTDDQDYWEQTVVFTSTDQGLHTTHVKYLEAELVKLARNSNRIDLMNGNNPRTASLSGAVLDEVKEYFSDVLDCFSVLGIGFFEPSEGETTEAKIHAKSHESSSRPKNPSMSRKTNSTSKHDRSFAGSDILSIRSKGVVAYGYATGETFVVKAGSQAVKRETPSALNNPRFRHIPNLRRKLAEPRIDDHGSRIDPVLADRGTKYEFVEDYTFNSPSAAACTVLGASSNGYYAWRDDQGRNLGELRNSVLDDRYSRVKSPEPQMSNTVKFDLFLSAKGIQANGRVVADGFMVARGSQAVGDSGVTTSIPTASKQLRQDLIRNSTLKPDGNRYMLVEDVNMRSPSRAAGVLLGASYNGNRYWKDVQKRSLDETQQS